MTFADELWDRLLAWLRDPGVPILLIVVGSVILIRLTGPAVHRLMDAMTPVGARRAPDELSALETRKRVATLDTLVTAILRTFIIIVAGLMVLAELGIDIGPALAGLGIAGVAVGFGAQSLVKDYFNGALILMENQFSKGDVVTIAGTTGTVEDFSLRRTTLRDLDGVLHTVPNSEIKVASNKTRVWASVNLDVTVAHGTDVEHATRVVDEACEAMAADRRWSADLLETPRVLHVEALGEWGITLKVVGRVAAPALPAVNGELRSRLLKAFAAGGIELPRPQHVVLAKDPDIDPFTPGGATVGPTQEDLSTNAE